MDELTLSNLPKTWIIDLDGTIVKHNGHLSNQGDQIINNSKHFLKNIPKDDKIIILTARTKNDEEKTILFLKKMKIRYDIILFDIPVGERILINDKKPSGLQTSFSLNTERDVGVNVTININKDL